MTKIPEKVFLRFSDEEKRIMTELVEEQHGKLRASGALLGPPSVADIIRSLIAREGARLDAARTPPVEVSP